MKREELLRFITTDSAARRQFGVTLSLAFVVAMVFLYLLLTFRYVPEFGIQLMFGGTVFAILLAMGPRVTFPMYFATWFGTGIPLPGLPLSLNRVLALVFLASWVAHLARRHLRLPRTIALPLLAVLTLYAVATGLLFKFPAAEPSVQQLMYLAVTVAVASTYRRRDEFVRLLWVMLFTACAINSVGLLEFVLRRDFFPQFSDSQFYEESIRINGIALNAIQYAFSSTWMLPWTFFLLVESPTKRGKILSVLAFCYLVALCLLTHNRQTPIIIAAMVAAGLLLIRSRHRALLIGAFLLAAVAVAPFVIAILSQRFDLALETQGRRDPSFAIRYDKYVVARHIVAENPWFGIGLNNFKDHWNAYRQPGTLYLIHFNPDVPYYVDLGYLQILTELGIVGLSLFAGLVASALAFWRKLLRRAARLPDTIHRNLLAALAMNFVQLGLSMLLQDTFFTTFTYLLFGFLLAVGNMSDIAVEEEVARLNAQPAQ